MKKLSFQKSKRLLTSRQFKAVLSRRLRASDELMILFMSQNNLTHPRLGISIPRSIKKAVLRNRLKRLIREAFRQSQYQIPQSFDYLVLISAELAVSEDDKLPKDAVNSLSFEQVQNSFLCLVEQIRQSRSFPLK
jgi:ribonuclease P protein component